MQEGAQIIILRLAAKDVLNQKLTIYKVSKEYHSGKHYIVLYAIRGNLYTKIRTTAKCASMLSEVTLPVTIIIIKELNKLFMGLY